MNKKCEKIYTPITPGQLLETKSFSPSILPAYDITALTIDENFLALLPPAH